MRLQLQAVSPLPRGIYGASGDRFPSRAALLQPAAATAFAALEGDTGGLVYSDMWRSAESTLAALETKRGVKAPGYSAHGYGLAIDVAVDQTMLRLGCTYPELTEILAAHGWHCHRRDGERGHEAWHFNFLGSRDRAAIILGHAQPENPGSWGQDAEVAIQFAYPEVTDRMEPNEIQMDLALLGLYHGTVDGVLGRQSQAAAQAFARAWRCPEHGPTFERTLRFVAAEIVRVDVAA